MRIALLLFNVLAVLVLLGCAGFAVYLCKGVVTCAPHPHTLTIGVGIFPILSFLISSPIAVLAVRVWRLKKTLVVGLSLGAVAAYTSLLAFVTAIEFVSTDGFGDTVPILVYGTFGVLALVPTIAVTNLIVTARALAREPAAANQDAA